MLPMGMTCTCTLELAQVQIEDYFKAVVAEDLTTILRDIRDAHVKDETTADETAIAAQVGKGLQDAMSYEGSPQEKQIRAHLATLGINYDDLTKEEFVTLIGILEKSSLLKNPKKSQRGKASPKRGKGKR